MKLRALVSVSDKQGLLPWVQGLTALGYEILSTGGTAENLERHGVKVLRVSEVTDFPEILAGRVKTLHPEIFGGILARLNEKRDLEDLTVQKITPISLVCVNLYPFSETVARGAVPLQEAVEKIDVGGPSMIRAGAKNFAHVAVVVDPSDYEWVLELLKKNQLSLADRFQLACKAFAHTADYDCKIAQYLTSFENLEEASKGINQMDFPQHLFLHMHKSQDLRYGENPHQKASFYLESGFSKAPWKQSHGKELSFNNILDATAAFQVVAEFKEPTCAIIKHTNPCGVACHEKGGLFAFQDALACDPVSAFGGIVALNTGVTLDLAQAVVQQFFEVILAPDFSEEALAVLRTKKNLRILQWQNKERLGRSWDVKCVQAGFLVQQGDVSPENLISQEGFEAVRVVTKRVPTEQEWKSLAFAWKIAHHVKSNAIVLAVGNRTVGIGAGQMSRVDSSRLACWKAKEHAKGAVLASDAFFPFRDAVDSAAEAGITALVEPGGSVRDTEVIQAADEHHMAMVFTGRRHFRH